MIMCLKERVAMLCALAVLAGGGWCFSSVWAQQNSEQSRIASENARRSSCQSNLKQVALAMMQYTQDYDEKMPPARQWAEVLQPYARTRQIFRCPQVSDPKGYGYAFNSRLSHKNYNAIPLRAQMVMIYETTDLRWNAYGMSEKPAFRHLDGANYAFADGHIKLLRKTQIPQFTFQPRK